METPATHPSVREIEAAFLRKGWWLFPLLGAVVSLGVGGPFWKWVEGCSPFALAGGEMSWFRAGLFAAALSAIPAVWRLSLSRKPPGFLVAIAVGGTVWAAEIALRLPLLQAPLWLAARTRLDSGQYFMSEVCYVRLEESAGRRDGRSAVVLVGSSQMLNGVDEHALAQQVHPMPVIRRAMFGMTPLKALAMRPYMPFRPGDTCVQYLSEFDFTNQDEFPYAWFRPYASWQTLPDVMRCIPASIRVKHWRQAVDYAVAATFEWWRARDFLRQIVFHFHGRAAAAADPVSPDTAAAEEEARGALRFADGEWNACQVFVRELVGSGVRLLVFEGDVNPSIYSEHRMQAKERMRRALAGIASAPAYRFVTLEEQGLSMGAGHWRDMTHLNPEGRALLTHRIAEELLKP